MELEELKAEAERLGYTLTKKREYIRLKPCVCGHDRRERWTLCGTGFTGYRYVCKKCGFEGGDGSSERAARIAWNEAVGEAGDVE